MTKIITATAFKGGATKTTVISLLGAACARAGLLTVMLDCDMQGNLTESVGLPKTDGFFDMILNNLSWRDGLVQVPKIFTNLDDAPLFILPGGVQTGNFKKFPGLNESIANQLAALDGWADVVLIDTAPGYDDLHAAMYATATDVILPTTMELDSVKGIKSSMDVLRASRDAGIRIPNILGIFPNRFNSKYTSHRNHYSNLHTLYEAECPILEPVMENVAFLDARDRSRSIYSHLETINALKLGQRYDKRAANRAIANFNESLATYVIQYVRESLPEVA